MVSPETESGAMFALNDVVPWGRSYDEYCRMFALTDVDLRGRILGCADGPAGFNAEAARRHTPVTSCDPLYAFSAAQIRERIQVSSHGVLEQTRQNWDAFVWTSITSIEELGRVRMEAMETFLDDYECGRDEGRYVQAALPALPFKSRSFDLAVCSHFLFLYSELFDLRFHCAAIIELCRVAGKARIFPLLKLDGSPSPHATATGESLRSLGYQIDIQVVPYEFQRGGNAMMRVREA